MKTSDKILLISSLSSLGIFGLVHLMLFAKQERGEIQKENGFQARQLTFKQMTEPYCLVMRGLLQIHIIPSDSFSLEFRLSADDNRTIIPKESVASLNGSRSDPGTNNSKEPVYHREGDTLFIDGEKGQVWRKNADMMIQWPFPVVNVYCRHPGLIKVEGGQVTLVGGRTALQAGGRSTRMTIRNGILWVGQFHGWNDPVYPEFFDTLQLHATNSTIMLNHLAATDRLQTSLSDNSLLQDLNMDIGQLEVGCDSSSRVNLTGKNLQKLRPAGP
ncbi:MAG TPA: hypothetical protein VGM30_18545 [Puia sp.]|jgi:hypothetical protein